MSSQVAVYNPQQSPICDPYEVILPTLQEWYDMCMFHRPLIKLDKRLNYFTVFDSRRRVPFFAVQWMTPDLLKNGFKAKRPHSFRKDCKMPPTLQVDPKEWKSTGYHRGHLVPAADNAYSDYAMKSTFLSTNIAPQDPVLNMTVMKQCEDHIRTKSQDSGKYLITFVITAALFLPRINQNGQRIYDYPTIGINEKISVPTHFYKMAAYMLLDRQYEVETYIMPNENPGNRRFEEFKVEPCTINAPLLCAELHDIRAEAMELNGNVTEMDIEVS